VASIASAARSGVLTATLLPDFAARHPGYRLGARPMQVALAWLLHHAPNILLIPGTASLRSDQVRQ
jgi:aryl-alcohol dehydrogenase-like predicted oxidoreductase